MVLSGGIGGGTESTLSDDWRESCLGLDRAWALFIGPFALGKSQHSASIYHTTVLYMMANELIVHRLELREIKHARTDASDR